MHMVQLYPGFEVVILCFTLEAVKMQCSFITVT